MNYIEAESIGGGGGSYIEDLFSPKHNVRYIAITDGVDSLTRQEMDITPFKNILNDMYSRDISKRCWRASRPVPGRESSAGDAALRPDA